MKTAIIEKYTTMGGTCLNVGCIPSKALLDSSHHFEEASKNFSNHGININGEISLDFSKMISRKNDIVSQTTKGIEFLMKKNNIKVYNGFGSFVDKNKVKIKSSDEEIVIESKNIIIATGSKPSSLPFIKLDKERVITSTEALNLKEIPKHLIIIGGGVIGLELGQVYKRLGAEVSIVEYMDKIIPTMDSGLSKELTKVFKKQKLKIHTSHKVTSVERVNDNVRVMAEDKNGKLIEFNGDYCLLSVGRSAYTDGLNLESVGLKTNDKGQIQVNDHLQTSHSNIYAIGDVVKGAMLAHKAEEEGVMVAEIISGQKPHIDYNLIPGVVYTWPEVASVGKTEDYLKKNNIEYKVGQFPMRALGRSRASSDLDGFVKILADKNTDEIIGVHMIGARCADLISEAVIAMEYRASAEDIARISHAHPTYSEAIKEAALAATENRALHI
jgi:dihydrolipoamide dehydrogenase